MSTMIRDSRTAASNFHLTSDSWDGVPKPKFLYYIRFVRSNAGTSGNDWAKGIGVLAKNIDRPKVNFETETLNQYNKKRVVQTRVEYEPVSFTFYDTVDNKVLHMFEDYFRYYYGDPNNTRNTDWSWDVMSAEMNQGSAGWGFIPPTGTNNTYFFSHIELYYIYGGYYSRYDLMNPKVKSFQPSDMSYTESDGAEITMQFEFEGYAYQGNNIALSSQAGLIQEMGLGASGFYEPRTNSGSALLGQGERFTKMGANPFYDTAILSNLSNATGAAAGSSINRSSTVITGNETNNNIVTGVITRDPVVAASVVTGTPTIGDNLAKRLVNGLKA